MPDVASYQPLSELNPGLAHTIEEAILFGKLADIEQVLDLVTDHADVSDELRYGLESLRHFRAHYGPEATQLPLSARQRIVQFDADWSMQLIEMLHRKRRGQATEKYA